jgi:enamine deaminase RidA (YjgF/YER057c/UK114 family)
MMAIKIATASILLILASANVGYAQEIHHFKGGEHSPLDAMVSVPPGYTTYYVSGVVPKAVTPGANGGPANYGDVAAQTRSVLDSTKARLATAGLTFSDVVKATIRMTANVDLAVVNKVWSTEFGTAAQPYKPARAVFHAIGFSEPGMDVEMEFVAAKK